MTNRANRAPAQRETPASSQTRRNALIVSLVALIVAFAACAARLVGSDSAAATAIESLASMSTERVADSGPHPANTAAGSDESWQTDVLSRLAQQEYLASQDEHGLQAPNRAHNLRTHFRDGGIDVVPRQSKDEADSWQFAWRTSRWGRFGRLATVNAAATVPRANGARVTYSHAGLDEWYENKKEGLEQGFTIHERPSGSGPLVVAGQLGGGLSPLLTREEEAIDLLDEHGARVLRYGGLHVWDADGDELPSHLELDGVEVAIVIEDDGATYPLTIDPILTSASWTAESDQANAEFGYSVATAGDVNGDGFSDVIAGARKYDNGQSDEGRAYVFLGSPNGLNLTPAWTAEGDSTNAYFGVSVASAGDVNGDGFFDVIVGADGYAASGSNKGRAFLYFGSAAGLATSPAWTADGGPTSEFGRSVATAGDVNGDGFSDIIVGAWQADNGETDEGQAFVYHGSPSGLAASPAWTGEANQASTFYGFSVATAGDVNGDGYSDVIVGAFFYDNGQTDEGRAFVYHGSPTGLATTATWTGESNQTNAFYGWSVSTAGDVDGDGFCDVIVGALSYDNNPADEGGAFVYRGSGLGLATTPAWSFESGQGFSEFGASVATAGDVNGDGYADIIIGAPSYDNGQTNEGRARIHRGSATGLIGASYWNADGDQGGAFFGGSVATAGDVNGDGFSDVIVSAWAFDNGAANEGRAFVYHGSADELAFPESWSAEGDREFANFGISIGTAGDVNGDGYSDVIVGASQSDNGQTYEGRAFVYLGSPAGLGTSPAWTAEGDQESAGFGISVGTAGDVNGDGFSDVIVGAPGYDNDQNGDGRAYVYLGSPAGLAISPAWTVESDQNFAGFGISVGTAGDVNGDGFSDVIVGAPDCDNGQDDEGLAYVYLGSPAGLAAFPAWTGESNQAEARFGYSVGTAGDVNGDGFSDVVVGAYQYSNGQSAEGRAYVYQGSASGLATPAAWTAESNQPDADFGRSVGTGGDVNGDGFSDVIVGAHDYDNGQSNEGRAFVFLGSFAGLVLFPSWTAEGNQIDARFGFSVGTAGDVNGDGFSDVIVGAPFDNGQQSEEGRAYVYYGTPAGLATLSTWAPNSGQAYARFGWSVGTAGDANGDGFSDVIAGAVLYDNGQGDAGRTFAYYGNLGDGLDRIPQQWRMDNSPIAVLGLTDDPSQFRLRILGRTPAGRGRVRIEGEVQPYGTPFVGGTDIFHEQFEDTGVPGPNGSAVTLAKRPGNLDPGTLYCWRVRTASNSPFFPRSPWFTLAANALTEADLRTAPLPTAVAASPSPGASALFASVSPNPFGGATKVAYTLPEQGHVRLAAYDVTGRRVATIAEGARERGSHIAQWDGRNARGENLPAGHYLLRLEFGGRVEARKVVIAR
jgi:FG-GAP repeat/FlgD Ig-like domain/FG-GAP-like repeat